MRNRHTTFHCDVILMILHTCKKREGSLKPEAGHQIFVAFSKSTWSLYILSLRSARPARYFFLMNWDLNIYLSMEYILVVLMINNCWDILFALHFLGSGCKIHHEGDCALKVQALLVRKSPPERS